MPRLLVSWLDENCHRDFPLVVSDTITPGMFRLPEDFLVDMLMSYASAQPVTSFFISKVITDGISTMLELSCNSGVIGFIGDIPFDSPRYTEVSFSLKNSTLGIVISGKLTVGDVSSMGAYIGTYPMDATTGTIYPGCVIQETLDLAGIQVGDLIMTGIVQLQEGDGIQLIPVVVDGSPCIKIVASSRAGATSTIVDDASLTSALIGTYGTPIRSINGVLPNTAGNLQIVAPSYVPGGAVGCIALTPSSISGVITIDNTCSEPCCDDSELQVVVDNIATLNATAARITAFQNTLDTSINIINTQLAAL